MGKVKYSEEMKLQTVKYVLEGGKSATKISKELGIDTNTVCRWVREYREAQGMPSYEAEQRIKHQSADEIAHKIKELEKELKRKERELADEKEKIEILKKCPRSSLRSTSLCNHKNEMRGDLRKSGTAFREKDVRSLKDQSVPSVDPAAYRETLGFERLLTDEQMRVYQTDDRNATVIENQGLYGLVRRYLYEISDDSVAYTIGEIYYDAEENSTVPDSVYVFIETDYQCYYVEWYRLTERLSVEWLTSFGLAHTE